MSALIRRLQESPFLVLELGPEAAQTCPTPRGSCPARRESGARRASHALPAQLPEPTDPPLDRACAG